jgi:hypothetical protein
MFTDTCLANAGLSIVELQYLILYSHEYMYSTEFLEIYYYYSKCNKPIYSIF